MGTDFYFRMGNSHTVCQDYALAGVRNGLEYAILSDGCSGSIDQVLKIPTTDFGARILTLSSLEHLSNDGLRLGSFPKNSVILRAKAMAEALNLGSASLEATLLVAIRTEEGVWVYQSGDGVVAARHRSGCIEYTQRQFRSAPPECRNTPLYLSYLLKGPDYYKRITNLSETMGEFELNGPSNSLQLKESPIEEGDFVRSFFFPSCEYDIVMLFSDGVESFTTKDNPNEVVPLHLVLNQLFSFKSTLGEFITRRCNFFRQYCEKSGWRHEDDLSIAGITL